MAWAHYPLRIRVKLFNREFGTTITKETLGNNYRRLNIRNLAPQYRMYREETQQQKLEGQKSFVYRLIGHMMSGRLFGFYDQSTYHPWMKSRKTWRYPDGYNTGKQFQLLLPRSRGSSITVHALLMSDGRLLV